MFATTEAAGAPDLSRQIEALLRAANKTLGVSLYQDGAIAPSPTPDPTQVSFHSLLEVCAVPGAAAALHVLRECLGFVEAWQLHLSDQGKDAAAATVADVLARARKAYGDAMAPATTNATALAA